MLRTLLPCQDMTSSTFPSSGILPHNATGSAANALRPTRSPPRYDSPPPSVTRLASASALRLPPPQRSRSTDNNVADSRSETPRREVVSESSTHDATTASYRWPRFEPKPAKSSASPPLLFVDYRAHPRSLATVTTGDVEVSGYSPSSASRSSPTSPSSRSHTSLSSVTTTSSSSRDRNTSSPRSSRHGARNASSEHVPSHYPASAPADHDLQSTLHRLDLNTQGARFRRRAGGSPPWHPYSSESESSSGRSPTVAHANVSRHGTLEPETEEWMRYAKAVESGGSSATYTCLWPESKDGRTLACGYSSKKHLVKRHVESKHLKIKPIICEVCGKGFSQRTNYSTHMNTHTGAAPHKCQYPGCDATFGDPARRHRHMKAVHNHVPSKRRTQSDSGSMHLEIDMSEPEEEDST